MMRRHATSLRLAAALIAPLALACGGHSYDTATGLSTPNVATITLTASNTTLAVRQPGTVAADFKDVSGHEVVGVTGVTWSSSDASTVTVDQTGAITAIKLGGPVTITASQGGVSGSATITVTPIYQFTPALSTLVVDSTVTLSVNSVDYFGATLNSVTATWASANPVVARVDASGRVTGVAAGIAGITATFNGLPLTLTFEVGAPSPLDGTWIGQNPGFFEHTTVIVFFGFVRSIVIAPLAPAQLSLLCTAPFEQDVRAPISANQFAFAAPYGTTVTGQFASPSALSVTVSPFTIPAAAFHCTNNVVPANAPGGPFTYAMTRTTP